MNDDNKFEEAYSKVFARNITVDELSEIYDKHKDSLYRQIYCPECQTAVLIFAKAKAPYLKTWPNSPHDPECSLRQEEISSDLWVSYLEDSSNNEQIQNRLNRIIESRINPKPRLNINRSPFVIDVNNDIGDKSVRNTSVLNKKLPQKILRKPFRKEDIKTFKIFYGSVRIKVKTFNERYAFDLFSLINKKAICRLWIKSIVYQYLPHIEDGNYEVALVGILNEDSYKDKTYYHLNIFHSSHISWIKLD